MSNFNNDNNALRIASIHNHLDRMQQVKTSNKPATFIQIGLKSLIYLGVLLAIILVGRLLGLLTTRHMLWAIEVIVIVGVLLYASVSFCISALRSKLIKRYKKYPFAVYTIWNMDGFGCGRKTVPGFIEFHFLAFEVGNYHRSLTPVYASKKDLEELEAEIGNINEQLKIKCLSQQERVLRFLISTCRIRANYGKTFTARSISNRELLSIKDLLVNSFNSDFARECVLDILSEQYDRYPFNEGDLKTVKASREKVFTFFEKDQKSFVLSQIGMYALPLFLSLGCFSSGSAEVRRIYIENQIKESIENEKLADAVIVKLNILEKFLSDSLAFEEAETYPVKCEISYRTFDKASYIGGIYNNAVVQYDGDKYYDNSCIYYTFGTNIKLKSYSIEEDDIPARATRIEEISLSKDDLRTPYVINHSLWIAENRGRYTGYGTHEYFTYTFSIDGLKLPSNKTISEKMLSAYNESNSDVNIKKGVKEHYFDKMDVASPEEIIQEKTEGYKCIDHYGIDLSDEVTSMRHLVEYNNKSHKSH